MPQATLAAVIIVYSIGLIHPKEFEEILKVRRTEFIWALTAFAGVVLLGTLKGIIVAILVSLLGLAYQLATPMFMCLAASQGPTFFGLSQRNIPPMRPFPDCCC